MQEVRIRRLRSGSIFKLIFFGSWVGSIPVFFGLGILAASGVEILSWNEKYVTGWKALIGGPLIGLVIVTIFGVVVACLTALGHWILSKGKGMQLLCELDEAQSDA